MKEEKIWRFESGALKQIEDVVVEEQVLNVFVNKEFVKSIFYSNGNEEFLSYGVLYTEGVILSINDIKSKTVLENAYSKNYYFEVEKNSSSIDLIEPLPKIEATKLFSLMREMLAHSLTFAKTGGTHIVGVSCGDTILSDFEDVSRLSAILKVAGFLLSKEIKKETIIFTSGRVNFNMVEIAKKIHSSIIVSQSAVTELAMKNALESNITLIGFLRGNRFNIYTFPERISI